MPQLEHIAAIEKRLWNATDTQRANSWAEWLSDAECWGTNEINDQ